MTMVTGYTDRPSVRAGEEIACHVGVLGSDNDLSVELPYRARLVRVTGIQLPERVERMIPVPSEIDGERMAEAHPVRSGAHGIAPVKLDAKDDVPITIQVTVMPCLLTGSDQTILSLRELRDDAVEEISLGLDGSGLPTVTVTAGGAVQAHLTIPTAAESGRWYQFIARVSASSAEAEVRQISGEAPPIVVEAPMQRAPDLRAPTTYLACRGGGEDGPTSFFDGRLEGPSIKAGWDLIAHWDLGRNPAGFAITDLSGNDNHGQVFGLPIRAVTGSTWDGTSSSFVDAPSQFNAIHFPSDAVEDAGWPAAFTLRVTDQLPSGLYAFELDAVGATDVIPFVVLPAKPAARAVLVVPTATYMAYSNARFMWERVNWEIQCERTPQLGRGEIALVTHAELGASSYDQYLDGTPIAHVSWRRPNLDMRAGQLRRENYPSDLSLIGWLHDQGIAVDVITDHEIDTAGRGVLDQYGVVITGTHPEYMSSRGCEALGGFVQSGGRLAVLGGNAFHFLVAFSEERPWIMEVRKTDHRLAGSREAAELHLALTGEIGDPPDAVARPSEAFLGTSTASMGFDAPRPYERTSASDDPRVAFIFEGVADRVLGEGGPLGGAVSQEWDSATEIYAEEAPQALVLARSSQHSVNTRWFGATKRRNHAEMAYFTTLGGGAVFSSASMAWCPSLELEDVSRVTSNLLRRFLDPAPLPPVP
jgi:N,N-dimethylformamidase